MNRLKNSQSIQITGSSGVSIGDVQQTVGLPEPKESEAAQREVKVLFLAANPSHTPQLRLDAESKAIGEALRSATSKVPFFLEQSWAASYREFQDGLLRYTPDIVHWSGHGLRGGLPMVEEDMILREVVSAHDRVESSRDLAVQALGRLFSAAKGNVRCIVLNACHSESLARVMAEHVDCVIGMSRAVRDASAIRFSWSFYNAVASGCSIQKAFNIASAQIGLDGTGEEKIPQLFASRTNPSEIVFG